MRTTVTLADDVAAAVEQMQRIEAVGVSEAINRLVRRGLSAPRSSGRPFRQGSVELGLTLDVSNVADALELLDGSTAT
jgi:hypothetical protein